MTRTKLGGKNEWRLCTFFEGSADESRLVISPLSADTDIFPFKPKVGGFFFFTICLRQTFGFRFCDTSRQTAGRCFVDASLVGCTHSRVGSRNLYALEINVALPPQLEK